MTLRKTVVSGIRATGRLHIGNYYGVMKRAAEMSHDPSLHCYFFVADLHTLTTHKEARLIAEQAPEIILDLLACGVDPMSAHVYLQSSVPKVTELMWYLSCLSSFGQLERMPTFKDKAAKHPEDVNAGLFTYPVLMAADILGVHGELVPVGKDQKVHIEFARDLAQAFNRIVSDKYFTLPDPMEQDMILVPALAAADTQGKFPKMGKSEKPQQTIFLGDSPEERMKKIAVSPTDPARVRRTDPGNPDLCAIGNLHNLISQTDTVSEIRDGCQKGSITCRDCKEKLNTSLTQELAGFTDRKDALQKDPDILQDILSMGSRQASALFRSTTERVGNALGISRSLTFPVRS